MDSQFSLTRTWLAFILLYNAAQCLHAGAEAVLFAVADQIVVGAEEEVFEDAKVSRETALERVNLLKFVAVGGALIRLVSVGIVVWLFRWRSLAFWAYCVSVALNFVFQLWSGEDFLIAAIDFIGLAGLVALMIRIEPGSWEQLD